MDQITATIMAHPKRKKQANKLLAQLAKYPFTEVSITMDNNNDEWTTGERALRAGIGKGSYHVVIQDDALLSPAFYDNLTGAIAAAPTRSLISLYTGTVRPYRERVEAAIAKTDYANWLQFHLLLWGVGIAIPSDHIEPLLDFVSDPQYCDIPYDGRVGIFYQRNMIPVLYAIPSLVDHDDSLGSLLDHGVTEPRVAHKLAAGPVAWNSKTIDI